MGGGVIGMIWFATALTTGVAAALAGPAEAPPPAVAPPVLAGPRVDVRAAITTLVNTDYGGKVRRLESPPEEAALALMTLSSGDRGRVDDVLRARARILDDIVRENLLLLNRIDTASKSGRKLDTLLSLVELYAKFQPLRDRGLLHDEVEAVLPAASRPEFNRLVGAYWDAIIAEGLRETKADGDQPGRVEVVLKERFEIFGREIERSFKRYEKTAAEDVLDRLVRGLNLSADQQSRAQPIVDALAQAIRADAPEKERGVLVLQLMSFLTADQQAKLIEAFNKLGR